MGQITLQVIDGADRGRIYDTLTTPVTIGREEGNSIQLNDERVSRFHLKIQKDEEKFVLTDLESTNGTKVNGEDIQLRILRFGDMITVGRSVLVFGSPGQIAQRLAELRGAEPPGDGTLGPDEAPNSENAASLEFELNWQQSPSDQATLHALLPPDLPGGLTPVQAAQLSELLEYMHIRIRHLLNSVRVAEDEQEVALNFRQWQNLLELQTRLAVYLRNIGNPEAEK